MITHFLKSLGMKFAKNYPDLTIKPFLNRQLKGIGEVRTVVLESENRKISITLSLKGEEEEVLIEMRDYIVSDKEGRVSIQFGGFASNREWVEAAANRYLKDREFVLPEGLGYIRDILS
ncbi:MAG: hypothetical protein ABIL68_01455 [bacterium]